MQFKNSDGENGDYSMSRFLVSRRELIKLGGNSLLVFALRGLRPMIDKLAFEDQLNTEITSFATAMGYNFDEVYARKELRYYDTNSGERFAAVVYPDQRYGDVPILIATKVDKNQGINNKPLWELNWSPTGLRNISELSGLLIGNMLDGEVNADNFKDCTTAYTSIDWRYTQVVKDAVPDFSQMDDFFKTVRYANFKDVVLASVILGHEWSIPQWIRNEINPLYATDQAAAKEKLTGYMVTYIQAMLTHFLDETGDFALQYKGYGKVINEILVVSEPYGTDNPEYEHHADLYQKVLGDDYVATAMQTARDTLDQLKRDGKLTRDVKIGIEDNNNQFTGGATTGQTDAILQMSGSNVDVIASEEQEGWDDEQKIDPTDESEVLARRSKEPMVSEIIMDMYAMYVTIKDNLTPQNLLELFKVQGDLYQKELKVFIKANAKRFIFWVFDDQTWAQTSIEYANIPAEVANHAFPCIRDVNGNRKPAWYAVLAIFFDEIIKSSTDVTHRIGIQHT